MTNEVAIKAIQDFMGWFKSDSCIYKALKMAISAMLENEELSNDLDEALKEIDMYERGLSQEPCDDAISRDAVREILEKYHLGESRIAEELNELPSVQRTSNADKKHVENTLDDAISRETLIAKLTELIKTSRSTIEIKAKLIPMIQNIPSVTQKSGKWITEEIGEGRKVYCSECKESAVFEYVRDGDIYSSYGHGVVKKTKYCPNCGARMAERTDE